MKYAIPDPWVSDTNPFDFDIEGEGRRRQANARGLNKVKPNAAQKAATRREIAKWREAAKLSREFNKFKKDYGKAQHEIKKFQRSTTQTVTRVQKVLKPIQDTIKKVPALEKAGKEATRVIDAIKKSQFAKVSKAFGSKMAGLSGAASLAFGLAGVGLGLANLKLNEITDETQQNQLDLYGREIGKQLQILIKNTLTIRNLEKRTAANDAAIDVMSAAIGEKTRYIDRVINEFQIKVEGQKTINDKQGELIVNLVKTVFTDIAPTVSQQKTEVKNLQAQVKALGGSRQPNQQNNQSQINQLNTKVNNVEKKVEQNVKDIEQLKKVPNLPGNILQKVQDAVSTASNALGKASKLEKEIPGIITKLVDGKVTEVVQATNKVLKDELGIEITKKVDKDNLVTEIKQRNGEVIRVLEPAIKEATKQIVDQKVKPLEVVSENVSAAVGNILEIVGGHGKKINDHTKRIDREEIDNNKQAIDIEILKQKNRELDKKIREQEKVNQEGNKKLDDLLKWSLGIPPALALIPRKTADLVNPNIPSKNDIKNIVKDNTPQSSCRFTEVPIYDAANRVNTHTSALDVVQTGLITANTAISNTINDKLGAAIPGGGIGGSIKRIFENSVVDRAINIYALILSFHNAAMLSNSLFQSILSAGDLILQALGFKVKDAEGNETDLNQAARILWQQFLTSIFGAETVKQINENWARWNRIYQSAANLLSLTQSMFDSLRSVLEVTSKYTGQIGNALKSAGVVFDNSYDWMSEKLSSARGRLGAFQRFSEGLESAENITSNVASVAGSVVSVQSELNEFKQEQDNFTKAVTNQKDEKDKSEKASTEASKSPSISIVQERNPSS
ncbi:MAG: hypothetical protein KME29_03855 [Calothrix sp. FI2-JRJ7]|jgi:uncharacterized coiled-coil protein SlyX|nr:hypothetical protein [Calothrix sp. FI2-JRJ7]MBW4598755.1 hypothetical protein [Calothrix sp. FI2-JRJ7]